MHLARCANYDKKYTEYQTTLINKLELRFVCNRPYELHESDDLQTNYATLNFKAFEL